MQIQKKERERDRRQKEKKILDKKTCDISLGEFFTSKLISIINKTTCLLIDYVCFLSKIFSLFLIDYKVKLTLIFC